MQDERMETILLSVNVDMVSVPFTTYLIHTNNQEWIDHALAWNKSEYNVSAIHVPSDLVWMPDVFFSDLYACDLLLLFKHLLIQARAHLQSA